MRLVVAALLLALSAGGARADEVAATKLRPPGPGVSSAKGTWLGQMFARVALPVTLARRDAARAALAAVGTPVRPDAAPYQRALELAKACLSGAPSAGQVDVAFVVRARGVSIEQLVGECDILRAQAESELVRVRAELEQRAQVIRPLLRADRLLTFDAEGEPDCAKCAGDPKKIAQAREWIYVRGPEGPLATYDTRIFVFRGDRLVERRQRRSHEQP